VKKFFFIKLILISLFINTKHSFGDFVRSTTFNDRPLCDLNKGVWREFGNGCVDNCNAKFDNYMICTTAITYGCDCGKGKCWHENKCIKLSEYEKIYSIKKEQDDQNLQKQKKARQEELKAFQQERLGKLIADKYSVQSNNNNNQENQNSDQNKQQKLSNTNNYGQFYSQEYADHEIFNNQNQNNDLSSNGQQNNNQNNQQDSFLGSVLKDQPSENKNQEFEIPPVFLLKEKIKEENLNKNGQEVQTLPEVSIDEFSSKK